MIKRQRIGKSGLPLRPDDPTNTVEFGEALEGAKHRPDIFSDEADDTLDIAALQIGLALRRARIRKGLKQEQLSELTGIGQGAISAIERGRGRDGPSFRTIRDLARALNVTLALKPAHPIPSTECRVVSESPAKLVFEEGFEDANYCWAIVRTLLQDTVYSDVHSVMKKILNSSGAALLDDQAICGLWRLIGNTSARMRTETEMLIVATNPTVGVKSESSLLGNGGYFTVAKKGAVEVTNKTSTPLGILTVPVTPSLAAQSRS